MCRSVRPKSTSHTLPQDHKQSKNKCSFCNRHGHVREDCKKEAAYDAAKLTVPNAPSAKQPTWGKLLAADAGKQAWRCSTIACDAWYMDTVHKCTTCGKQRLKDKEDKKPKAEIEYLTCSKQGQEVLGRLCLQEDGDDIAMPSSDYTLPLDQVELVQKRAELTDMINTMTGMGVPKDAVELVRLQLSKLPLPSSNQPVQDWACLTAQQLQITKEYRKKADLCDKRKGELIQEKQDRAKELSRELEVAAKEYDARVEAISRQHAIHLADTLIREEANLAMSAKLETQNAKLMDELKVAIELASKKENKEPTATQAVPTRPPPPVMAQAPVVPLFTAESVLAQMQAASSGAIPTEQAAAFAAMMNSMLTAAMAPAPAVNNGGVTTPVATEPSPDKQELIYDEKLAEEVASLNGGGKPGFTGKVSNRVSPLSG
jgi:hypothetical protein